MAPSDSPTLSQAQIMEALAKTPAPGFAKDPVSLRLVRELELDGNGVRCTLVLPSPLYPVEELRSQVEATVRGLGAREVHCETRIEVPEAQALIAKNQVPGVKNVIAVSSGKGGVGKSTVAVNLACSLAAAGASVGILDADVYGPNVPIMLGVKGSPQGSEGKIHPLTAQGLQVMSMAFLVPEDQPVIWRGPMLHSAMKQFLFDVKWKALDYLIVDLPPGTGDAQLSLAQQSHLMGAVIVTTPQDVSVLDVNKAIQMFKQVNVPVLGIVENMAGMSIRGTVDAGASQVAIDTPDGSVTAEVNEQGEFEVLLDVFGHGGGDAIAKNFDLPILGRIPLDPACRVGGDSGKPIALGDPQRSVVASFQELAKNVSLRVAELDFENSEALSV